jgi:hypothetical protein
MTSPSPSSEFARLAADLSEALARIRHALRAILDRLLPHDSGVRAFARSLDLGLTTAWRCWSLAHVADVSTALKALPGDRGWGTILARFEARGVDEPLLDALRRAIKEVSTLLADRRLSRSIIRAIAAGQLASSRDITSMLAARREGVRSNTRLYGLHCKTRVAAVLLAAGTTPGSLSLTVGGCFDRLVRTRPGMPWPIHRRSAAIDAAGTKLRRHRAIGDVPELPMVISRLSSKGIFGSAIRPGLRHSWETIDLCDLSSEDRNGVRLVHAEMLPDAGVIAPGEVMSFLHQEPAALPLDLLVLDLLIHRAVHRHTEPSASLHGTPIPADHLASWGESVRMPLEAEPERLDSPRLPRRLAAVDAPYRAALRIMAEALGAKLDAFDLFRLTVPSPPLFSVTAIGCELKGAD